MLRLRPHHGMCIANFVGRGYDEVFTVNMNQTAEALKAEPQQEIWPVSYTHLTLPTT